MGSVRITLCAGTVLAAALAPATVAHADEARPGQVRLTPSTIAAGGSVEVRVDGCEGTTGSAGSGAFVSEVAPSGKDGGNPLYGEATIDHDLEPGTYRVTVECDGYTGPMGSLEVVGDGGGPTPTAPVHAGGGATAELAASEAGAAARGPSTSQTVLGGVLAGAAGLLVTARVVRRRRRTR